MNSSSEPLLLCIDLTHRGFGFAVLEGSDRLIDWGIKSVSPGGNKTAQCLSRIRLMIELYQPDVIVLEDCDVASSRRCPRVRRLIERIRQLAREAGVKARLVSRAQVRKAFAPAATKQQIAAAIAQRLPELASILPPPRTAARNTEDARMNVFDAVALGLTFLSRATRQDTVSVPTPLGETR
jgi:hypothetical protein